MTRADHTPATTGRRAAFLVTLVLVLTAFPAGSRQAHALSITCGQGVVGVGLDYVDSLPNGHPDKDTSVSDGWGGSDTIRRLNAAAFGLGRTQEAVDLTYTMLDHSSLKDLPAKIYKVPTGIAKTVIGIAIDALESASLALTQRNARVDDCSETLLADFVDVMFVTQLEEELANLDVDGSTTVDGSTPRPGSYLVPSAMFVLPQDGWPAWHSDSTLYGDLAGHADPERPYVDGALNGPYLGVATTVRDQIAFLEAAGIDTGATQTIVDPFTGEEQTVLGAKDEWERAMGLLAQGHLREAYVGFAAAYQRAVTATPPPGPSDSTDDSDTEPSPWG